MNEHLDYKTKDASKISKFFWWCAGADEKILKYSTYSDHVKFFGIGGVVVATGLLGFLSMAFAMYTIFSSMAIAIIVGIIWGLIVFNLDRFIVSSTGKGDGKETIGFFEFINATPRLLMAILLGITISAPLETFIFDREINREWDLVKEKMVLTRNYELEQAHIEGNNKLNEALDKVEKDVDDQKEIVNQRQKNFDDETMGRAGSRGYGREAMKMEEKLIEEKQKLKVLETKRDSIRNGINKTNTELELRKSVEEQRIMAMPPGFLDKLMMLEKLAGEPKEVAKFDPVTQQVSEEKEEIYGSAFWPIWLVRILFMIVEIVPVIFKLMLIKGPYDYMQENIDQMIKARQGVGVEFIRDEHDKLIEVVHNQHPGRILAIIKEQSERETENALTAIREFAKKEKKKIVDKPEDYISPEE